MNWIKCSDRMPPSNELVMTKIDDENGERSVVPLRKHHKGSLWFHSDGETYVYYSPTHWAQMGE